MVIHRHELIEHTIVQHQQHRLVCRVILQAKEALAGIIGLHIVHVRTGNQLLILLTIGREGHTAMEEHLQIGPYFLQMSLARQLHHAVQY